MDASQLFSDDYSSARGRFLAAAAERALPVTSYRNPHALGPNGEDLTTEVIALGPHHARNALVIQSGVHGVEGYAGSGCQIGFIRTMLARPLPADTRIVLIHALNPYGFAWNRRVNEDNVDLNRNFIAHGRSAPENKGYDTLRNAIEVSDLGPATLATADERLKDYAKAHGLFALQEAISQGQYRHPQGLYFGGDYETWSAGLFKHLIRRELGACGHVAMVDVHTGLGPYGFGELISEDPADSLAYRRARAWWGDTVLSTKAGESVSADVTGSVDSVLSSLLPHAEITMCTLEYGTYSSVEVFRALRADNWLHVHGDPRGQGAAAIKGEIRRAFYPDCGDWKEMVWARAAAVFGQALEGLAAG